MKYIFFFASIIGFIAGVSQSTKEPIMAMLAIMTSAYVLGATAAGIHHSWKGKL